MTVVRKAPPKQAQQQQTKRQRIFTFSPDDEEAPSLEEVEKQYEAQAIDTFNGKLKSENLWYIGEYFNFEYVDKNSQGTSIHVKCKIEGCGTSIKYDLLKGTTSGMINHLKNRHKFDVKKGKNQKCQEQSDPQPEPSVPYQIYSPEYLNITKGVLYHLIKDKQSLNQIESRGYRFLLARSNSRYRPPSRYWLASQAIPALYHKCKRRQKQLVSKIGHRISVTTDGWKNIRNCGFTTLTGRFAVLAKEGIVLKERLLDFKTAVGAQVASTVLKQLQYQADSSGVYMSEHIPCIVTSDRGSNIKAAISSSPALRGISCMSHVLHRAVLEAVDNCGQVDCLQKAVSMATAFARSIPRTSHFSKWQSETEKIHVLLPVTFSDGRWHGYLDCIMRHLLIQDRIVKWISHVQTLRDNDNLNVDPLMQYVCTKEELAKLQGLAYVLHHLRLFDSIAQATTQASGVKYARVVKSMLQRLAYIASLDQGSVDLVMQMSDKDRKIVEAVVQVYDGQKKKIMDCLSDKDLEVTGQFAKTLYKSISNRYTLAQLEDILFIGFWDPLWQTDLPKWAVSKRMTHKEQFELVEGLKRKVVALAKAVTPLEEGLQSKGPTECSNRSGVSPQARTLSGLSTQPTTLHQQSSHQSNQQASPDGARQDFVHPPPPAPENYGISSQDSQTEKADMKKAQCELNLDQQMLGRGVKHGQDRFYLGWADDEQHIILEIEMYLNERAGIEKTDRYVDPLAYWFDKRNTLPTLFNAAMKVLSVPATSVLSEQVFSGAGNISCKQRARLAVDTIEKLVLLQRSMTKEDVENIVGEDFRVERRRIDVTRKERKKREAYQAALKRAMHAADAAFEAEEAEAAFVTGTDSQMVLAGDDAFDMEEMLDAGEEMVDIDDALDEIHQVPMVEGVQNQIAATVSEFKMLTRSQMRQLSNGKDLSNGSKKLQEYMAGGLD